MFSIVYPLLQTLDPSLGEETWYRIFSYQWGQLENYCGYGLFDDQEIVGFLGLIFSQRIIQHTPERFCNISSWIVKESYRGHSVTLMLPVMKLKDYTLTDLSSLPQLFPLAKRLGFQQLDAQWLALFPWGGMDFWQRSPSPELLHDPQAIHPHLTPNDVTLLRDHQCYDGCHHLLLRQAQQDCYVIYTVQRAHFPYAYLQFISNPSLFAQQSGKIRRAIARQHNISLILVDSRLVRDLDLPGTMALPLRFTKLYKSDRLTPQQIDNLYSELVLLNFNLLPTSMMDVVQRLRRPDPPYEAQIKSM